MTNKKPETIADLDINYTFTDYDYKNYIHEKIELITKNNQTIVEFIISPNNYKFLLNEELFKITILEPENIVRFIERINWELYIMYIEFPRKLKKFELISENTFRIHLED